LCGIHDVKPQRCLTLPFSAYRDEADRGDLLLPRTGWACGIFQDAPEEYRDKRMVARDDFDAERNWVTYDVVILKPYGQWLMASTPSLSMELRKSHAVVGFW
jgi:hypothetical protein